MVGNLVSIRLAQALACTSFCGLNNKDRVTFRLKGMQERAEVVVANPGRFSLERVEVIPEFAGGAEGADGEPVTVEVEYERLLTFWLIVSCPVGSGSPVRNRDTPDLKCSFEHRGAEEAGVVHVEAGAVAGGDIGLTESEFG